MTASSCRGRSNERGWVLLSVLVISTLYFALIALLLWEATIRYRAAQRFRARVVAQTLAENAAEVASRGLATGSSGSVELETADGLMVAEAVLTGNAEEGTFHVAAAGRSSGLRPVDATVDVWGRIRKSRIIIDRTLHSQ